MNRRQRDILKIILNREEHITGSELSKLYNVTIRTVRRDIKELNELLKQYDIKITSVIKKGYILTKDNKKKLNRDEVIKNVLDYEYINEKPSTPIDRQIYILARLILRENLSVEKLTEYLYVSEATIVNDIAEINKWISKKFKFKIKYSISNGITFKASEGCKRNLISWILSRRINESSILKAWNYLFDENTVAFEVRKICEIVDRDTKKQEYFLTGHATHLFAYEIIIANKRNKLGFKIEEKIEENKLQVISDIEEDMKKALNLKLTRKDWGILQNSFKSKQLLYGTSMDKIKTEEAEAITKKFIEILKSKYKASFLEEAEQKQKLMLYIVPMINRLRYKHCIPNKLEGSLEEEYEKEVRMARELIQIIRENLKLNMGEVEVTYIALLLAAMKKIKEHSLNMVIICDYDEAVISLIKVKVKSNFGDKIKLHNIYSYQQFKYEANKTKVEFIISTSTLADITDIPFVIVNPKMTSRDIENIREAIATLL